MTYEFWTDDGAWGYVKGPDGQMAVRCWQDGVAAVAGLVAAGTPGFARPVRDSARAIASSSLDAPRAIAARCPGTFSLPRPIFLSVLEGGAAFSTTASRWPFHAPVSCPTPAIFSDLEGEVTR